MRTFIAGILVDRDVDRRRLWRDLLRPLHVVPAPPQAVTLPTPAPPTMATTNLKSGALAIHRGDGPSRRQVPWRSQARQQHHKRTRPGKLSAAARHAPTIGDHRDPSPIPICRGSVRGVHPHHPHPRFAGDGRGGPSPGAHPHPRFAGDRGSSPSPVPIGDSVPCHPLPPSFPP
jgi:hypothetical protein